MSQSGGPDLIKMYVEQCQTDVIFLVSGPGAVFENMRKVVCIELGSVPEELEAGWLLAVEDSHPEHDRIVLKLALAGEAAALVVGGAGGVALVLERYTHNSGAVSAGKLTGP